MYMEAICNFYKDILQGQYEVNSVIVEDNMPEQKESSVS